MSFQWGRSLFFKKMLTYFSANANVNKPTESIGVADRVLVSTGNPQADELGKTALSCQDERSTGDTSNGNSQSVQPPLLNNLLAGLLGQG